MRAALPAFPRSATQSALRPAPRLAFPEPRARRVGVDAPARAAVPTDLYQMHVTPARNGELRLRQDSRPSLPNNPPADLAGEGQARCCPRQGCRSRRRARQGCRSPRRRRCQGAPRRRRQGRSRLGAVVQATRLAQSVSRRTLGCLSCFEHAACAGLTPCHGAVAAEPAPHKTYAPRLPQGGAAGKKK